MSSNTIRIDVVSSPEAFALKDQLLADGLHWGIDFTWQYNPAQTDWDYSNGISACVKFSFRDDELATYYRIK